MSTINFAYESAILTAVDSFSNVIENTAACDLGLTASVRAVFAACHGVSSGQLDTLPELDSAYTERACRHLCEAFGVRIGFSEQGKRLFNSQVRAAVARVLKRFGSVKVSAMYTFGAASRQAPKCAPMFTDPSDPNCQIGLRVDVTRKIIDEFGDRDQVEPSENVADPVSENNERVAFQEQAERDRQALIGMAQSLAVSMVASSDAFSDGQRDALLAILQVVPEIATANLNMVNDRDLITELKGRGFNVRRKATAAKLA
jgi:hypothetical protein